MKTLSNMPSVLKYLVPISESQGSLNALNYSKSFFSKVESLGFVVHVKEETDTFSDGGLAINTKVNVSPKVKEILKEGNVVEKILETSFEVEPDLIIIGAMGENKDKRFFASERTTEVVLNSRYPVLIIPPDINFAAIHSIVIATDMRTNIVEQVRETLRLFRDQQCLIHLLILSTDKPAWHYHDEVKSLVHSVKNYWDYEKIFVSIMGGENLLIQLEMFLKEQKADLLVFDKSNEKVKSVFFQKPERQMPCCTDIPIMVLPGQ